jgi:hypothetical protein
MFNPPTRALTVISRWFGQVRAKSRSRLVRTPLREAASALADPDAA